MTTKKELKEQIESAIRNMNRNIYEWVRVKKAASYYNKLSYEEVHGLAKNWLVRKLRVIIPYTEISSIFKRGNFSVTINDSGYVQNMSIWYTDTWASAKLYSSMLNEAFSTIDYHSLRFCPRDLTYGYTGEHHAPVSEASLIDLSSIENIKFE